MISLCVPCTPKALSNNNAKPTSPIHYLAETRGLHSARTELR